MYTCIWCQRVCLSVCLSDTNFDPNYIKTGRREWAENFLGQKNDLSSNQNQKPFEKKVCMFGCLSCFCKLIFASKTANL